MTEVIEPSFDIEKAELTEMISHMDEVLSRAKGVSICGTFPPGITPEFYAAIAKKKNEHNFLLLLDSYTGVSETLETKNVDILKINAMEIRSLIGEKDIKKCAEICFAKYNVRYVAVTDGRKTAHLFEKNISGSGVANYYEFTIPNLGPVVNPIGAGDVTSAVLLSSFLLGYPPEEAFR